MNKITNIIIDPQNPINKLDHTKEMMGNELNDR